MGATEEFRAERVGQHSGGVGMVKILAQLGTGNWAAREGAGSGTDPPVMPAPCYPRHKLQAPKAKRKAESWERSVGTFGSSPQLSGLVVVKKTDLGRSIQRGGGLPTPGRFLPSLSFMQCQGRPPGGNSTPGAVLVQGEVCPQPGVRGEGLQFPFFLVITKGASACF